MRYALAALLVLVTVGANATNRRLIAVEETLGASGQQSPLPPPSSDQAWCTGTCPFSCKFRDAKTGKWSKPEIFECNEKTQGTDWTQSPGESYMRACGHQKWCFSFNGGPELSADELADRAKMLERIEKLEKRVAELEKRQREEDERRLKMWKDLAKLCDSGNSLACESIGRKKP